MSDWPRTRLGDAAEILMGQSPPGDTYNELGHGLPFMQGSAEFGERTPDPVKWCTAPTRIAEPGDLLISVRAPVGDTNFADQRIATGRGLAIVRAGANTSNEFLRLTVQHSIDELLARSGSGMFSSITAKELRGFPIALPSLAEQSRIVDLVSAVDTHIEALASEARATWVVYQNSTGLLWRDLDGAEAGRRTLAEVMVVDIERLPLEPARQYRLAGVLNAGQGLIDKGVFLGVDTEYTSMIRLRSGQVVMRKLTAWEGPIAVIPDSFDGFVASNEFPTFTLREAVCPEWMVHVCRTPRLWHEMKSRVTGTVQRRKRLNPDQLLSVELPVPSTEAQLRATAALDALLEQRAHTMQEAARLRSVRTVLLKSLLSQKVVIPERYDAVLEPAS